jgi:hypothetical protein
LHQIASDFIKGDDGELQQQITHSLTRKGQENDEMWKSVRKNKQKSNYDHSLLSNKSSDTYLI